MTKHQLVVLSNPVAGREEEFNRWYDERHVPDLLDVPGFVAAQRFRLSAAQGLGASQYSYMALYEVEADDPQTVMNEVQSRLGTPAMPMSDAMDHTTLHGFFGKPITPQVTKKTR